MSGVPGAASDCVLGHWPPPASPGGGGGVAPVSCNPVGARWAAGATPAFGTTRIRPQSRHLARLPACSSLAWNFMPHSHDTTMGIAWASDSCTPRAPLPTSGPTSDLLCRSPQGRKLGLARLADYGRLARALLNRRSLTTAFASRASNKCCAVARRARTPAASAAAGYTRGSASRTWGTRYNITLTLTSSATIAVCKNPASLAVRAGTAVPTRIP